MDNDIGSDLLSMAVCFDFCSTNVVQLSYRNPYFYQFRCHHPLIIQLSENIGACKSINSYSKIVQTFVHFRVERVIRISGREILSLVGNLDFN